MAGRDINNFKNHSLFMQIKDEMKLISKIKHIVSDNDGYLFNLYISGSDLYGWRSQNSDIDMRGIFVLNKNKFLGLDKPIEVLEVESDHDIVLFEIKKAISLALKGNCNMLEEINATQLYKKSDFIKLKHLINNSVGKKGVYSSYKGLAEFNYKKFILHGRNTVKKYLYVFRGLLAGIYFLQTGHIQPSITELNENFKISEISKLIEIKRQGKENEPLRDIEEGTLDAIISGLFDKLDEAYIKSKIPESPTKEEIEAMNKFLVHLRNIVNDINIITNCMSFPHTK